MKRPGVGKLRGSQSSAGEPRGAQRLECVEPGFGLPCEPREGLGAYPLCDGSHPAGLIDQDVERKVLRVGPERPSRLRCCPVDRQAGLRRGRRQARRRIDGRGNHGEPRTVLEPTPDVFERREIGLARRAAGRPEREPDHSTLEPEQDQRLGGRQVKQAHAGCRRANTRRLRHRLRTEPKPAGPRQRDDGHCRQHSADRIEPPWRHSFVHRKTHRLAFISLGPQDNDRVDRHAVLLRHVDDDLIAERGRTELFGLPQEPGVKCE
jgi:hypothetical protein